MLSSLRKWRDRFLAKEKFKPLERFTKDIRWVGNFNSPEAYCDYYFVDMELGIVGELSGGISPLRDTFYMYAIEVYPKHRRNHYDLSMLANIAQFYDLPITPMSGIDRDFLERMHKMCDGKFKLNAQMNAVKMDAEILKWTSLSKTSETHSKQIFERLINKVKGT